MGRKISGKEYENWSKEELIKELVRIRSTTYGLVWKRDLPEEKIDILVNPDARTPGEMFINEIAGKPFPVLKEVKGKIIETNKEQPTNLLIEGDNYHSLAVLNFTHRAAVDLIYIDPPYNTGNNDFIYNDKFVDKEDTFRHSKWLSFMEKRLKLARNLLKSNGVIFISIDDNEQAPLKMLCDEVFGEENFVTTIIWQKKYTQSNDAKYFSATHDYILCYAKNLRDGGFKVNLLSRTEDQTARYSNPDNDSRGPWASQPIQVKTPSSSCIYEIKTPAGRSVWPPKGRSWQFQRERYEELVKDNRIWFGEDGGNVPRIKKFLSEVKEGVIPKTIWLYNEVGSNDDAKRLLKELLPEKSFDSPKPVSLIKHIIRISEPSKDGLVLDFMAGSGTTGHAVAALNKEDGGNRRFILCTNNENNICTDICYPRISKIIKGYKNSKEENISGLGGNLRYYKTDFVEAEPTDRNKRKLVKESTDMLCIHESAFESVVDEEDFKVFRNHEKYLGIVFYEEAIDEYKKTIKKIDGHFNTYVFSLGEDPHAHLFSDVANRVTLCAIPEAILKVYREIFK